MVVNLLVDDPDPAARSAIGFEVVSAFGTVGLSTGLTGALDAAGQLALAMCMLLGRISVLALAVIIARGIRTQGGRPPRGVLRVA
jgi:trk system potassium uptake protein TrkH